MSDLLLANIIGSKLIEKAEATLGIRETTPNAGPDVEKFQRYVDGRAVGEPWCMSWLQFIVGETSHQFGAPNPLVPSELCRRVWNSVPDKYRGPCPAFGWAVIWKGHCGLVTRLDSKHGTFETIEGNTNSRGEREGDAVCRKTRLLKGGTGSFELLGFVDLPSMIRDSIPDQNVKKST